jgi:hypothetical protein
MTDIQEILVRITWRLAISAPFLAVCVTGAAGIASPFFGVIGAVIVAGPLARLLAYPAGWVYFPEKRFSCPPPMYSLQESKRAKGRYEEAMAGFAQIAEDYPDEVEPHIHMIDIAIVNLRDGERANQIFQHGIAVLKSEEDKETLARMYRAIRTRLDTKMSN